MAPKRARLSFVFIVAALSMVINMEASSLPFLYIDRNFLVLTLAAVVTVGLLFYRDLLFAVLVGVLVIAINLPADFFTRVAPDVQILHDTLVIVTFGPIFLRLLGFGVDDNQNTRPATPGVR